MDYVTGCLETAKRMREMYPSGTRVKLESMGDDIQRIPDNTFGTVDCVDDIGTIHVAWDNGSHLGLIPGIDKFSKA